jgi:hypothetical protein
MRLQKSGSIIGRVVDDEGAPLVGIVLDGAMYAAPHPPTTITALPEPNYTTDLGEFFRIDGLAPGMKYSVKTRTKAGFRVVFLNATVESGKTTDLGDLKLMPLARLHE